jgi:hypothetical protein
MICEFPDGFIDWNCSPCRDTVALQLRQARLQNGELCKVSERQQEVINGLLLALRDIKHKLERSHDGGCILPLLDMVIAAEKGVTEKPKCEHNWVDARNKFVESGEVCLKCCAIRAGNQS